MLSPSRTHFIPLLIKQKSRMCALDRSVCREESRVCSCSSAFPGHRARLLVGPFILLTNPSDMRFGSVKRQKESDSEGVWCRRKSDVRMLWSVKRFSSVTFVFSFVSITLAVQVLRKGEGICVEREWTSIAIDRKVDGRMGGRAWKASPLFYLYSSLYR